MDFIKNWFGPNIPVEYVIGSFIVLCLIILLGGAFFKGDGVKRFILLSLCCEYYFLVLCSTVILRTVKDTHLTEFMPFWNYMDIWNKKDHPNDLIEVILNIVMFIPIGLLISSGIRNVKWWHVAIAGCCLSLIIEVLQFVTGKGLCETDDLIHNTLGACVGWVLYNMIRKVIAYASVIRPTTYRRNLCHGEGVSSSQNEL